jgi:hypothetical protein
LSITQKLDEKELGFICKNSTDRCVFCVSYNKEKRVIQNLTDDDLLVTSSSNAFILSLKLARQYSKICGIWGCNHYQASEGNLYIVYRLANLIKQNSTDIYNPASLIQGIYSMMENPKYKALTDEFFAKIGKGFIKSLDPKDFELDNFPSLCE